MSAFRKQLTAALSSQLAIACAAAMGVAGGNNQLASSLSAVTLGYKSRQTFNVSPLQ